jgi:eukaryotic-like serine/threonine-protein kinase
VYPVFALAFSNPNDEVRLMAFEESKAASIFLEAVELHEPVQQAEYVRQATAGDPALVERVAALLKGHHQSNPILDEARLLEKRLPPIDGPSSGTVIGPYKLLEQIGEGGMGLYSWPSSSSRYAGVSH